MRIFLFIILFAPLSIFAQVSFEDVASELNITWEGKSFGASWADVTGNGFPDLFMQCHSNFFDAYFNDDLPRYYFNTGLTFTQQETLENISETDWHGGMMFDFDNDGDLDHLSVTGGSSANIFFINEGGDFTYENEAFNFGLDEDGGVGRTPVCIDANNDGFLDVLLNDLDHGSGAIGPRLLISNSGLNFTDETDTYGLDWPESSFSVTTDFLGDGGMNAVYLFGRPVITTLSENQFTTEFEIPYSNTYDFSLKDFNGDLLPDLFLVRASRSAAVDQITENLVRAHIPFGAGDEAIEVRFNCETETPNLKIYPRNNSTPVFVIAGIQTTQLFDGEDADIDLNEGQNAFIGVPAIEDTLTIPHVYIGFDQNQGEWVLRFKSGLNSLIPLGIEFSGTNTQVSGIIGIEEDTDLNDRIYLNEGELQFNPVLSNLFDPADNTLSTTAADFDNDMDVDIYVVRSSYAENKENILYENVNNEIFVRHEGAWGATGDGPGIGETVNSVDFDNDGFMDLFVTNGASVFFLDSARVNLYHNGGNENNWIKIVLKGTISNPLGLHAKVYAYAGGVAQFRYQDGGFHRYSQDDNRLHFGMAENEIVDSIVVNWPSGIHQVIENVGVNQILTIEEDITVSIDDRPYGKIQPVRIYPNPTRDQLTIDCHLGHILEVRLFDNLGKLIRTERYGDEMPLRTIDLQGASGVIVIEVVSSKGIFREKVLAY